MIKYSVYDFKELKTAFKEVIENYYIGYSFVDLNNSFHIEKNDTNFYLEFSAVGYNGLNITLGKNNQDGLKESSIFSSRENCYFLIKNDYLTFFIKNFFLQVKLTPPFCYFARGGASLTGEYYGTDENGVVIKEPLSLITMIGYNIEEEKVDRNYLSESKLVSSSGRLYEMGFYQFNGGLSSFYSDDYMIVGRSSNGYFAFNAGIIPVSLIVPRDDLDIGEFKQIL